MSEVVSMDSRRGEIKAGGRWAPLKNVSLCARALERAMKRSTNLPGFVSFNGPAGWGKSMAGAYSSNRFEGVLVECRSYFTKKTFVEAVLREMGVRPADTVAGMMEQAAEQLQLSKKPLIIDEADHLINRKLIEIVRDLHEMSRGTFLLIGEEEFPRKLLRVSERFHSRVLEWVQAQPASRDDCRSLAEFYCPVPIADDWVDAVRERARGVTRYICVNIDRVREDAATRGLKRYTLADWGKRDFYSGDAPRRGV